MRLVVRWSVVAAGAAAAFALAWWVCQELIKLDEGISLGIASAVLAIELAVGGWWATRDAGRKELDSAGGRLVQRTKAGRDANVAGRDQTIFNYRHRDE